LNKVPGTLEKILNENNFNFENVGHVLKIWKMLSHEECVSFVSFSCNCAKKTNLERGGVNVNFWNEDSRRKKKV